MENFPVALNSVSMDLGRELQSLYETLSREEGRFALVGSTPETLEHGGIHAELNRNAMPSFINSLSKWLSLHKQVKLTLSFPGDSCFMYFFRVMDCRIDLG